jgi:subtilisin-like proprotein convertase family protein
MDARKPLLYAVAILTVGARYSFNVYANTIFTYGSDFNLRIPAHSPDTMGWMDDASITVPDHFIIHDIDVGITLTHTSDFDLQIYLRSPAGKRICLNMYNADQFFKGENYTNTIFDDGASVAIEDANAPFTGRFRPLEPYKLSTFDNKDFFGIWSLQIYDFWPANTGTLNHFELMITAPEPATAAFLAMGFSLMMLLNRSRR